MAKETKYQPRVIRGRTELWVPHESGEIAFASPPFGRSNYRNVGKQILDADQEVPTGDYTASLLHAAYCTDVKNESEFENVRGVVKRNWLWVYNLNLWTDKGVYVIQDTSAVGKGRQLNINQLEKGLRGGKDISGIRFSEDGRVRFAPKGSYILSNHTPESLAKDGFIVASSGKEGAEKLGEVSSMFNSNSYTYGVEVSEGDLPKQRLSAVDGGDGRLRFDGDVWYDGYWCFAFGVGE